METFGANDGLGREVRHNVCAQCRAGFTSNEVVGPDHTSLRAGTLDGASWAVPIAPTFVRSANPWAVIPGVEKVDPKESSYLNLSAAWRATAPVFS